MSRKDSEERGNDFFHGGIGGLAEYLSSNFRPARYSLEISPRMIFDLGRRGVGLVETDEFEMAVQGRESEGKGGVSRRGRGLGIAHRRYSPTLMSACRISSGERYEPDSTNCSTRGRAVGINPAFRARRMTPRLPTRGTE